MTECCPACGYDVVIPSGVYDSNGVPFSCDDWFHMLPPRSYWVFGDIVRVHPDPKRPLGGPDDRRWMVLVTADTSAARQWVMLYLGDPVNISHWSSSYGFDRVEE